MQHKIIITILLLVFTPLFLSAEELESFKTGNTYGYKNESGKVVIPAKFNESWSFSEGCREPQAPDADRGNLAIACLDVAKSLFRQIGCNRRRNLHGFYFPGIASGRERYLR